MTHRVRLAERVLMNHLGLPVLDTQRSVAFYAAYFGFDPATAQRYPDGTVIVRNAQGFDLALHPAAAPPVVPPFLHFGFALDEPGAVRDLLARVAGDGVPVVERDEEPDLVSFKCLDPDGWRIEVYWER